VLSQYAYKGRHGAGYPTQIKYRVYPGLCQRFNRYPIGSESQKNYNDLEEIQEKIAVLIILAVSGRFFLFRYLAESCENVRDWRMISECY